VRTRVERRILTALRQGDRRAYETVIDAHYPSVYRFLLLLTGQPHLAEDLTQEAFTAAWAAADRFQGRASIGTWLHRIAYNAFVDAQRRRARDSALAQRLDAARPATATDPVSEILAAEKLAEVHQALGGLDEEDRIVLLLRYVEGLSHREIARVLNRPNGTVRWLTSRALKRLADTLTGKVQP
jgi:RNA polymerase sigma-70 factor (ECF subfamily)